MRNEDQYGQHLPDPDEFGAAPICDDDPHPRYEPGEYDALCVAAKNYKDPRLGAWKCRLEFILPFDEKGPRLCGFLNMGKEPTPTAGRSSKFRRLWVQCNGAPPKKRQKMSARVFKDKMFRVRIKDVTKRFDGLQHAPGDVYSVVEVLDFLGPQTQQEKELLGF